MTANEILKNFKEGLKMEDQTEGQDIDLNKVILDILEYLDYKESGGDADPMTQQYKNDKLWEEIKKNAVYTTDVFIALPTLRIILEKYKILDNEKNGM